MYKNHNFYRFKIFIKRKKKLFHIILTKEINLLTRLATYKLNKGRLDGLSITIAVILDKKDGRNDTVRKLKLPSICLKYIVFK